MKIYSSLSRSRCVTTENKVLNSKTRIAAGSLFDRLILDEEDKEVQKTGYDIDGVIRSVKRNLSRALNIHAGSASSNLALGIPDFNHNTTSSLDISRHLVESIQQCIALAEPRVRNITVVSTSELDTPMELRFNITGTLQVENRDELIRIDIAMRDGHFYPF